MDWFICRSPLTRVAHLLPQERSIVGALCMSGFACRELHHMTAGLSVEAKKMADPTPARSRRYYGKCEHNAAKRFSNAEQYMRSLYYLDWCSNHHDDNYDANKIGRSFSDANFCRLIRNTVGGSPLRWVLCQPQKQPCWPISLQGGKSPDSTWHIMRYSRPFAARMVQVVKRSVLCPSAESSPKHSRKATAQ